MINMKHFSLDNFSDFFVVCESATEPNYGFEMISDKSENGVRFLRFKACLQTFDTRNRNRRLWHSKFMKIMMNAKEVTELLRNGGVPCESGHPIPPTGTASIERILTIDPNNISHVCKKYEWPSDNRMDGIIETIDDGDGPGEKFRRNILQGLPVSFSTRSVIPQRKNMDGSIDQTGVGRYVCSDRVFVPSHEDAYMDKSFPVKDVCKKDTFETVMEGFTSFLYDHSEKIKRITDGMDPAMESAAMTEDGLFTVPTTEGRVYISPETEHRMDFYDALKSI